MKNILEIGQKSKKALETQIQILRLLIHQKICPI